MKNSHDLPLYLTYAVLISDPVAAASESGFHKNGKTEGLLLSYYGHSLKSGCSYVESRYQRW